MNVFHIVNALPDGERVHALFLGCREGSFGFEVTGLGTVMVPGNLLKRVDELGMSKGEDMNLKRDGNDVVVWRTK